MRYEKSCGAVVFRKEAGWNVLLIRHIKGRHISFPKGHVEQGETESKTAEREVFEETGLEVVETQYLFSLPNTYLYAGFLVHTLDQFFVCKVKDYVGLRAMDDVADSFWVPLEKVNPEEFGLNSVREGVKRFLKEYK